LIGKQHFALPAVKHGRMANDDPNQKPINAVLAENLKFFMDEKKIAQAALATKAGMGQTTVSLYLSPQRRATGKSGKEPSAKLAEVQRLADALGVELWELLRPLTPTQRQFYRSVEAVVRETTKAAIRIEQPALAAPSRKRQGPGAA
jgi:transcriptional regulator with XRE-family HTH domain